MECGGERETERDSIVIDGEEVPYEVTRCRRKTIEIVVEPGILRVRCPAGTSGEYIRGALTRHGGDISKRRRLLEEDAEGAEGADGAEEPPLTHLMYRGKRRAIVITDGPPSFELKGGKFLVSEEGGEATNKSIRQAYRAWMKARAEKYLPGRAVKLGDLHGIWPKKITVRQQSTRWGSATSKGALSLNAMILVLPTRLADYVILHELCHLIYTNHSPQYWEMLESVYPDVEWAKRELQKYADDV